MSASPVADRVVEEVIRLFPSFLADPVDHKHSGGGNAAVCVIDPAGRVVGHIFGGDKTRGRACYGIATRKVLQVWATGYATGRFEELVYAGKVDDSPFGLQRPDFIGWHGGVPLRLQDGSLLAAAFSGFRGETDVAILVKAVAAIPGVEVSQA